MILLRLSIQVVKRGWRNGNSQEKRNR